LYIIGRHFRSPPRAVLLLGTPLSQGKCPCRNPFSLAAALAVKVANNKLYIETRPEMPWEFFVGLIRSRLHWRKKVENVRQIISIDECQTENTL